ncbi:MAG: FHA domain-containing protein [Candidatus Cyclobacteriaceae bacterium M3_2C_046]
MANATQTIRTGMAYLGGGKVNSYSLEFLTPAGKYKPGYLETVVVPHIELGRSGNCGLQFRDDTPTVSRKHAVIKKEGDGFILDSLSQTNPTLLNNKAIHGPMQLKNGDEIQLSYEGPKLRFNAGGNNKVGFTKRINLVAKQAIKPYKSAFVTILILFIAAGVAGAYVIQNLSRETENLTAETDVLKAENQALLVQQQQLQQKILDNKAEMEVKMKEALAERNQEIIKQQKRIDSLKQNINPDQIVATALEQVKNSVLYLSIKNIRVELDGMILMDEPQPDNCHCTGFLLNDGRFITARHCIELYAFELNEFTVIANNGGKVTYEFIAISPDKSIMFEFTNHELEMDNSSDEFQEIMFDGQMVKISQAGIYDGKDWAVYYSPFKGNIKIDKEMSQELSLGTLLHCLGYTYGSTYQNIDKGLSVLYSKANVAREGLDNNTILVSGYSFDNGNSGGPLFMIDQKGKAVAVGIVSAGYTNPSTTRDDALGSVVPISNIPN